MHAEVMRSSSALPPLLDFLRACICPSLGVVLLRRFELVACCRSG